MAGNIYNLVVDQLVSTKFKNFPDTVYNLYPQDHLTHLLNTLLGDAGVGQLKLLQTTATTNQNLQGIEFSDLDHIVGSIIDAPRMSSEQYNSSLDPFIQQLPRDTWDQINVADSSYRERLALMMTAINSGATVLGLTLLSEAILGVPVRIIEAWKLPYSGGAFYYPVAGYSPQSSASFANQARSSVLTTNSTGEFLIVPQGETSFNQEIVSSLMQSINLLKPEGSIATLYTPSYNYIGLSFNTGDFNINLPNGYSVRPSDLYCQVIGYDNASPVPNVVTSTGTYITAISNNNTATVKYATIATGSISTNGTTWTVTDTHNFAAGDVITISGVTPTAYNGTYTIATISTTASFTITNSAQPGAVTVAGTAGCGTVADTSITWSDFGKPVTGTGIPTNAYVGTVTAGTSFVLSSVQGQNVPYYPGTTTAFNATANGTSITVTGSNVGPVPVQVGQYNTRRWQG